MCVQSNDDCEIVIVDIAQLSKLPLSTSPTVNVPNPIAFNVTVTF